MFYFGFWYQILRFLYCLDLEQSILDRLPESPGNKEGEGDLKHFLFGVLECLNFRNAGEVRGETRLLNMFLSRFGFLNFFHFRILEDMKLRF